MGFTFLHLKPLECWPGLLPLLVCHYNRDYCLKEKLRDESKFISVVIDIMPHMPQSIKRIAAHNE